jgi:hypothetical protein
MERASSSSSFNATFHASLHLFHCILKFLVPGVSENKTGLVIF